MCVCVRVRMLGVGSFVHFISFFVVFVLRCSEPCCCWNFCWGSLFVLVLVLVANRCLSHGMAALAVPLNLVKMLFGP